MPLGDEVVDVSLRAYVFVTIVFVDWDVFLVLVDVSGPGVVVYEECEDLHDFGL